MTELRGERQALCPRTTESQREPRQHDEVGVKLDALQAPDAQRREGVVVLQASELTRSAAPVEASELVRVPLDTRVEPGRAFDDRHDDLRRLLAP
jgi:hypothetical protein